MKLKLRSLLTGIALSLFYLTATAQYNVDSLKVLLASKTSPKQDTNQLSLLIKVSNACAEDEIFKYSKSAVELSDELLARSKNLTVKQKNDILIYKATALSNIALSYGNQNNYEKELEYWKLNIKILEDINDKMRLGLSLSDIGSTYANRGDKDNAMIYFEKSLKIREQINDKKGIAECLQNIGIIYKNQGEISKAIEYYDESLKIKEEIGDKKGAAETLNKTGTVYQNLGDIPKALDYFSRSLKIREEIKDEEGCAYSLVSIGTIYNNQGQTENALANFEKSLKLFTQIKDKTGIGYSLASIGLIYDKKGDLITALTYYNKSLKIREEIRDKRGIGDALNNIGMIHDKQGKDVEALECFTRALKVQKEISDKKRITITLNNIGRIYLKQKKYALAFSYCDSSLQIAKALNYPTDICSAEKNLSKIDSARKNYAGAFEHYKQFIIYKEIINNESTRKASVKNQIKYEFDKKAVADSVRVVEEKKVISAQLNAEKTKSYALYGGLALVLVFAGFMVNRFRVTNKQKKIIEQKEKQTQKQNEIITHQKHLVEEKHKEITDSINYAERIQRSFLATKEILNENLKDHFVYFQPKDIVSGDFYWAAVLKNNNFALVTADSTGHGVPGAIMSILNISCLEKAVEEEKLTEPGQILNHTRLKIIERLKKDGSAEGGKDGMDCSLISFDLKNSKLTYAAANNPIWIVRENKILELLPDKMPVGKHDYEKTAFTQHTIDLQKADVVYALTDGMPDQFGGPKGKKFMYKKLKELLISIALLPMQEQHELLKTTLNNWKGDHEQVDDICLIGVRI